MFLDWPAASAYTYTEKDCLSVVLRPIVGLVCCSNLGLEFEIPFRDLGFFGVPHKTTSFIMPTVNCLVELVDVPFTAITMAEVGIVNLERVGFSLRNFDMTFVFKVSLHIGKCFTWRWILCSCKFASGAACPCMSLRFLQALHMVPDAST